MSSPFRPLPPPGSYPDISKRTPIRGAEYSDDLGRPTAEQLLTLPSFVTGEIIFGIPVPFAVKREKEKV